MSRRPSLVNHLKASKDKPALCIIGEPTEMRPVYGHKGKLAMRCHIHGKACHSAYAPDGVNAIEYAAKLITRLGAKFGGIKTKQRANSIAIRRFAGQLPYQSELLACAGVTAVHLAPPGAVPRFAAKYFAINRAGMLVGGTRSPRQAYAVVRTKVVEIPAGDA